MDATANSPIHLPPLGPQQHETVETLGRLIAAMRAGDPTGPRVVVLAGPPGARKTGVVREFYRRLAGTQPSPGYWPAEPGTEPPGPLGSSKTLAPAPDTFAWPSGSLPTFGWWAVDCERMHGEETLDLDRQLRPQLAAHLVPLSLAWRVAHSGADRDRAARQVPVEVYQMARRAAADGWSPADLEHLGLPVPGTSWLRDWVEGSAAELSRVSEQRGLGWPATPRSTTPETLLSVVDRSVPGVLVVAGAQRMGRDVQALVDRVAVPDAESPFLVLACVDTDSPPGFGYQAWVSEASQAGRVLVIDLPQPPLAARVATIMAAAPRTSPADAERAAGHITSSWSLALYLSLHKTLRRIDQAGQALIVHEAAMRSLPAAPRDMYVQCWRELPPTTRQSLALAAGALHDGSDVPPRARPFVPAVVARAAARSGLLDQSASDALVSALADSARLGWCAVGEDTVEFRADVFVNIAATNFAETYSTAEQLALAESTVSTLDDWLVERLGRDPDFTAFSGASPAVVAGARWLLSLVDPTDSETPGAGFACWLVATALAGSWRFDEATALARSRAGQAALAYLGPRAALSLKQRLAWWTADVNPGSGDLDSLHDLRQAQQRGLGPDASETLSTLSRIASYLAQSGRTDEAKQVIGSVLAARGQVLGPRNVLTLRTRRTAALIWSLTPGDEQGISTAMDMVADHVESFGPTHPETLLARRVLAELVAPLGRLDLVEPVVADHVRLVGRRHPHTLAVRTHHAAALWQQQRWGEAESSLGELSADAELVLGPEHPLTLIIHDGRRRLAQAVAAQQTAAAESSSAGRGWWRRRKGDQ